MFQLTTSRRGRPGWVEVSVTIGEFQLTTSRRGRHEGLHNLERVGNVSTHDLTKRSTGRKVLIQGNHDVSTHDLTKRSTDYLDT